LAKPKREYSRLITPVVNAAELDERSWERCLEANFDRALDARYCLFREQSSRRCIKSCAWRTTLAAVSAAENWFLAAADTNAKNNRLNPD
jgi:hypothetical protein